MDVRKEEDLVEKAYEVIKQNNEFLKQQSESDQKRKVVYEEE